MLELLFDGMGVGLYLFEGFCMQYLFSAFAIPKIRNRTAGRYAAGAVWVMLRLCGGLLFTDVTNENMARKMLFTTILLFFFTACWYQGNLLRKVFLVIQFTAVRELAFFAAYSFMYVGGMITDLMGKGFENGAVTVDVFEGAAKTIAVLSVLFVEAGEGLLLFLVIRKIAANYRYRDGMDREIIYYLLPGTAGILIALLLRLLLITVEDENPMLLYTRYPALYFIIPLIAAVLLGAILFGFRLYQNMIGLQRERAEKVVMENQIMQMQNSLAEMEHLYDGVRTVRHDMKNHMAVLQNLLQRESLTDAGAQKELRQYFEDMDAAVDQLDSRVHTGNAVCDVVICSKFRYAEKEVPGIRLDAEGFTMSDKTGLRAYDIGVILNNGLDNAIEACKRLREKQPDAEPYIVVRSFRNGKMYFIEIENNFDGKIRIDRESGYPLSTKVDREMHGIGLKNIRSCAGKYAGDMDCVITDKKFTLSVMIKG